MADYSTEREGEKTEFPRKTGFILTHLLITICRHLGVKPEVVLRFSERLASCIFFDFSYSCGRMSLESLYSLLARRWFRIIALVLLFGLFLFQNIRLAEQYHGKFGAAGVIWSDARCYYAYLPATFIDDNLMQIKSGMRIRPGVTLSKVTYGVALLEAPFFGVNYLIQSAEGNGGNGFENSYGYAILVAASTYAFLGFCMLFVLFKKWFNAGTALITVIGLCYGTNMFHYIYAEPGVSHVFSFFCASGLLFFTDRFYEKPQFGRNFLAVTLFLGLIVAIRPFNIFMVLIFALYGCYSFADFKARAVFIFSTSWLIPSFALVGLVLMAPQMYYWHMIMDRWLVSPYTVNGERFIYLANPKIGEALFSHKGGWFTSSQIMLVSILALPFMIYKRKFNGWMILAIFLPVLYLCSSWWAINFMCAHGYRSFIDYYPILIIPFAWLFYNAVMRTPRWVGTIYTVAMLLLIYFACCMNLDFSIVQTCVDENWKFYDYIKMYDRYI